MSILNSEISITTKIPINSVSRNCTMLSEKAVASALSKMRSGIPIMYWGNYGSARVIGSTTSEPYAVQVVDNGNSIQYTVDGVIFFNDFEFTGLDEHMEVSAIGFSNQ